MPGFQNETAVSVIVGTLLLILITVIAAAGLAIMVSQMQKDEMNRQSHLTAVKNEQIQVLNLGLANDPAAWNQTPVLIPAEQSWSNWSSITLTMVNLNTDDVKIVGIAVNDHYARTFTTISDTPLPEHSQYNVSQNEYLTIPGTKSQKVQINFTDDFPATRYVVTGDQIKIKILTSLYNTFEKSFKPPNPVFEMNIETEDLGVTERDVLVLDGTKSTADNTVVQWDWSVLDRGNAVNVSGDIWNDQNNITTASGKTVRVTPKTPGPFSVKLKIKDDVGMTQTSGATEVPVNSRFSPPANLNAEFSNQHVLVTIRDINGNLMPGITVNFVVGNNPYGNLTFDRYYNTTDTNGSTNTNWTGGIGTIKVVYGKLSAVEIPVG